MEHNDYGFFIMTGHIVKFLTAKAVGLISLPLVGFFATDYLTGNVGLGAAIAALCSCATAIFVTRPKVIAAKAAAMVAQLSSSDLHNTQVFNRLIEIHKNEKDFLKERISRYEKSEILIRSTKHNLINAYAAANLRITLLEEILREHNVPLAMGKYIPESFHEITGEEDQKMIRTLFDDSTESH